MYSAQNTDTDVKASSDGLGWGSSSGCENQGLCARQGATMDTGDSGCGKERTAVTQGSCVVCAQLVRTGHSGWKGSATVTVNRRQGRICWSYGGSDQEARALTALVVALVTAEASLWEGDMK